MSSPVTAQLILVQGDTENFQSIIDCHNNNFSIGRAQTCDVIWGSLQISRKHCTMEYMMPKWYIRDTSTNGLAVNGVKLVKGELFPLKDLDIISFIPTGAVRYRFRYSETTVAQSSSHAASSCTRPGAPNGRSISPQPSTSYAASTSNIRRSVSAHEISTGRQSVEVINADSGSDSNEASDDSSNHSESLLSLDPQDDNFFSFSGDEINARSPADSESSSAPIVVVSKRKHLVESSDSDSNADVDRKKKRILTVYASDGDSNSSSTPSDANYQTIRLKSKKTKANGSGDFLSEDQLRNCDDIEALKEHLRNCMHKLKTTEVRLQTSEFERDVDREEFRRKQNDVQSVNTAFKEETYKKILELMECELSCSVCNEVFIQATVIDCGHTFCHFCINEWARKKPECPICRKSFRNRSRHIEMENFITKIFESFTEEIATRRKLSIVEREDQCKKALEAARAAATENQARGIHFPQGGLQAFLDNGRYVDFLAELHQINEILGPRRAGRGAGTDPTRRRSARIQDRVIDAVATGAAGNVDAAAGAPPAPVAGPSRSRARVGRPASRQATRPIPSANNVVADPQPILAAASTGALSALGLRARTRANGGNSNEAGTAPPTAASGRRPAREVDNPPPQARSGMIPIVTLDNTADDSPLRFPNFLNYIGSPQYQFEAAMDLYDPARPTMFPGV